MEVLEQVIYDVRTGAFIPDNPRATRFPERTGSTKVNFVDFVESTTGLKFAGLVDFFSTTGLRGQYNLSPASLPVVPDVVFSSLLAPVVSVNQCVDTVFEDDGFNDTVFEDDGFNAVALESEANTNASDSDSSDSDSSSTDSSTSTSDHVDVKPSYTERPEDLSSDIEDREFENFECRVANKAVARQRTSKAVSSFVNSRTVYRHSVRKTVHYGHISDSNKLACNRQLSIMLKQSKEDLDDLWPKCKDCFGS